MKRTKKMLAIEARIRREELRALRAFAAVQSAMFRWQERFRNADSGCAHTESILLLMDETLNSLRAEIEPAAPVANRG